MTLEEHDVLGRYKIVSQLGTGGMGTVYRARDTTLQRDVAIKVLNQASSANPAIIERFKREAKAVAGLSHPNVISLFDFAEADGTYYAVMELARGDTLETRMAHARLSRQEALHVANEMAQGLAAAHKTGVIHRDIKPSNVFLTDDNQVKLLDFGLATARQTFEQTDDTLTAELQTKMGTIMGTVGYMSPEQVRGQPSDQRSDIFSFGTVLFEMLAGTRAFKRNSTIETMSAILNEKVPAIDLSDLAPNDPLLQIISKCLEKEEDNRYASFSEVIADLNRSEETTTSEPRARSGLNTKLITAAAVTVIAITAFMLMTTSDDKISTEVAKSKSATSSDTRPSDNPTEKDAPLTEEHARQVLLPKMLSLVNDGNFIGAYDIGLEIKTFFLGDAVFQTAWERVAPPFSFKTDPPEATVYYGDYGDDPSTFIALGKTPIEGVRLSTSIKHFIFKLEDHINAVAVSDNHFFDDVTLIERKLFKTGALDDGMVHITEGRGFFLTGMVFDTSIADGWAPMVQEFLIDKHEVTNEQFKAFVDAGGYTNMGYWTEPLMKDGQPLSFDAAMELMIDTTGRPGPSTWAVGRFPSGMENYPVQGISWYEARAYANWSGKSLPTLYHWSRANATDFGSEFVGQLVRQSNINKASYSEVGYHKGISRFGVSDLCGNVSEWVMNAVGSQRLSLGGSTEDQEYFFNQANPVDPWDRSAKRGFRCIKYLTEQSDELLADVELQFRDYSDTSPVADDIFAVYKNQFDYDETALEAAINYTNDQESTDYIKQRVEFNTVYAGERMIAYLFLPRNVKPPYQSVIFFHGAAAINQVPSESSLSIETLKFIPQSGRALVVPVLKGQWDRNDGLQTWASNASQQYAEFLIKWTKDYRRTLDYLETRSDFDPDKFCYLGASWGAFNFLITGAVEPRITLSICYVGGLSMTPARPEVDQISYVHRVTQPTLWLVGEYDQIFPLKQSAQPAFEFLGTNPEDKRLVAYPTEHALPKNERIHESLDWLDKYFGSTQ